MASFQILSHWCRTKCLFWKQIWQSVDIYNFTAVIVLKYRGILSLECVGMFTLVCIIGDVCPTKFIQTMIVGWPWHWSSSIYLKRAEVSASNLFTLYFLTLVVEKINNMDNYIL